MRPSGSPKAQLAGCSGKATAPQRRPAGENASTPARVLTKRLPARSTAIPSGLPLVAASTRSRESAPSAATSQARLQRKALELKTRGEVEAALAQVEATAKQVETYRAGILKDTDKVRDAMAFSYQRGSASLLEWINAQRTSHEVYEAWFDALAAHAKARAALDRVTGGSTLGGE